MTKNDDPIEVKASLASALAGAQAEFPDIPRSKTVTVRTQAGGSYDFAYAPLDAIIKVTRPILAKHGLAVSQLINRAEGATIVVTRLMHTSGESIESSTPVIQIGAGPQAFGSALTYSRRYSYCAILCIQAEDDDDANVAEGNVLTPHAPAARPAPAPVKRSAPAQASNVTIAEIKSVMPRKGRTGTEFFEIIMGDGRKASTFNKDEAAELAGKLNHKVAVILTTSKDGKFLNLSLPEPDDDGLDGFAEPEAEAWNERS